MTDVHANLPALKAALDAIRLEGVDALVHTGDAIGIGPFPAECLEMLLGVSCARFVMGNHDALFVDGLPDARPTSMSVAEFEHQQWTHGRLDTTLRANVAQWPYRLEESFGGTRTTFVHYPLEDTGRNFTPIIKVPNPTDLDRAFAAFAADASSLIFYGHDHNLLDRQGRARYVNPGSLGCAPQAVARYALVSFDHNTYRVEHRAAPYNDAALFDAFERRHVPDRTFIYQAFFAGRFS